MRVNWKNRTIEIDKKPTSIRLDYLDPYNLTEEEKEYVRKLVREYSMNLYELELDHHTLRFEERELDYLWDCLVNHDIEPTYELIIEILKTDSNMVRDIIQYHASDTVVRDSFYNNILLGKYDKIIKGRKQ